MESINFKEDNRIISMAIGETIHRGKNIDLQVIDEVFGHNVYRVEKSDFSQNKKIVIDLGANIGAFSVKAALLGAEKVYAYEPNPKNIKYIEQNALRNNFENVIVPVEMAVAVAKEEVEFYDKSGDTKIKLNDLYESDYSKELTAGEFEGAETFTAKTISLEEIFIENEIEEVEVMKVDIEWAEYLIFNRQNDDLMKKIKYITLEFHGTSQETFGRMVAMLTRTHSVNIIGSYERGGFIYGRRY